VITLDGFRDSEIVSKAVVASAHRPNDASRFIIYVKASVCSETAEINRSIANLMLLGDGRDATIVTGSKTVHDGITTTLRSATFAITGNGFNARDMTFENTAVPEKNQAVALRLGSDLSEFYRCRFDGYQGTLPVHSREYMNTGTGADTSNRVKWPGYPVKRRASEGCELTVGNFLGGDEWIPVNGAHVFNNNLGEG
ncbi:pectinesterase, partial [Musa troglodytarum]